MKRLLKLAVLPTLLVSLFSFSLLNSSSAVSTESVAEVKENIEVEKKEAATERDIYVILNFEDNDRNNVDYRLHMWGGSPEHDTDWPGQLLSYSTTLGSNNVVVFENVDDRFENYIFVRSHKFSTTVTNEWTGKPINTAVHNIIEVYGWNGGETRVHASMPTDVNFIVDVPTTWTSPKLHLWHDSGLGTKWPGYSLETEVRKLGGRNYLQFTGQVPFTPQNVIVANGATGSSESQSLEITEMTNIIHVLSTSTASKRHIELVDLTLYTKGFEFVDMFDTVARDENDSICWLLDSANSATLNSILSDYNALDEVIKNEVNATDDNTGVNIGSSISYLIAQSTPTEVSINNIFGSVSEMNIVIVIIASILLGAGVVGFYYMNSKKKKYN